MMPITVIAIPSTVAALAVGFLLRDRLHLRSLAMAALVLGTALAFAPPASPGFLAWSALMVALLAALAVFDAETLTVPDALTVPMIATGMLHAALTLSAPLAFLIAPAALVAAGWLAGRLAAEDRFTWLGGGDVLIAAGGLAWLGPYAFADYMLLTGGLVVAFATVQILLLRRSTTRFALAPAAALAQIAIWFGGPIL